MNRARILIVDDDENWMNEAHLKRIFNNPNYEFHFTSYKKITTSIDDLIKKSIGLCEQKKCHVAIVDWHLRFPNRFSDDSGVELAKELRKMGCPQSIIISVGFDEKGGSRKVNQLKDEGFGSIDKGNIDDLRQTIQDTLRKCCASISGITIDIGGSDTSFIKSFEKFAKHMSWEVEDMKDVLVQLFHASPFPNTSTIKIKSLQKSGADSHSAPLRNSFVCLAEIVDNENKIPTQTRLVKFARPKRIEAEAKNYENYIDKLSNFQFYPPLSKQNTAYFYNIAAIVYKYVADTPVFSSFYGKSNSTNHIKQLQSIVECYKNNWQFSIIPSNPGENHQLFDIYAKIFFSESSNPTDYFVARIKNHLKETGENWQKVKEECNEALNLAFDDIKEPLSWLTNKLNSGSPLHNDPIKRRVIHGDLWGENILVKQPPNIIVIDFERTGIGYALQDYTHLEFDILTRLITNEEAEDDRSSNSWRELFCLYVQIVRSDTLDLGADLPRNDNMHKAWHTIKYIRDAAMRSEGGESVELYRLGLLFDCAFRITIDTPTNQSSTTIQLRETEKQRALLLASLIVDKIRANAYDRSWPPETWTKCTCVELRKAITNDEHRNKWGYDIVSRLAFNLNVDYENLKGEMPNAKMRDLYNKCGAGTNGLTLNALLNAIQEIYPNENWCL